MYAAFGGGVRGLLCFRNHLPYPTVFSPAIELRAAALIIIHNHPSGDPKPSNQDIQITKRLYEVSDLVGIKLLDHLVIGSERYFSMVDEGIAFS